ncbi:MAG: helix-turn-helix protein [Flavipsychrobacter sp.]|jgi:AraC-like DNA-binding protein|nr:helix-turn-helix protein [Flavipsychrobacter sp.]
MNNIPVRQLRAVSNELERTASFSIRDVRELLGGKELVQPLHRHEFFYILVLKKGGGTHEIDFTPYNIPNNSVFFMRPGQVHQIRLSSSSTGYLMQFRSDFYYAHEQALNELLRKAGKLNFYQLKAGDMQRQLALLANIFEEFAKKQEGYWEVIKANMVLFFAELVRQSRKITPDKTNSYTRERLDQFLSLLETNISENKEVSYYAGLLNLSPYQLNAITRETLGKTSSEVINEHIVLEARRHVLGTSAQVKEIAYHLGFEDPSYFIRFFKRHTGYSPEALRLNSR